MKRAGAALVALTLAACSPPTAEAPKTAEIPAAPQPGCVAESSRDWSAVGGQYYVVEAEASGATCADATATIRIKSLDGAVLFERAYPVADVPLAFNPSGDQTTRREEIEAWTQNTAEAQRADWLPPWPSRATRPPSFQPAPGVTRARYEAARGAQGPLFCYPDGGESNACVALAGGSATLLGSWTPERP